MKDQKLVETEETTAILFGMFLPFRNLPELVQKIGADTVISFFHLLHDSMFFGGEYPETLATRSLNIIHKYGLFPQPETAFINPAPIFKDEIYTTFVTLSEIGQRVYLARLNELSQHLVFLALLLNQLNENADLQKFKDEYALKKNDLNLQKIAQRINNDNDSEENLFINHLPLIAQTAFNVLYYIPIFLAFVDNYYSILNAFLHSVQPEQSANTAPNNLANHQPSPVKNPPRSDDTQRKARQAITLYETKIEEIVKRNTGKLKPLSDKEVVAEALAAYIQNAVSRNLASTERGLGRYLSDIGKEGTAKKYGGQLVGQLKNRK